MDFLSKTNCSICNEFEKPNKFLINNYIINKILIIIFKILNLSKLKIDNTAKETKRF